MVTIGLKMNQANRCYSDTLVFERFIGVAGQQKLTANS